MMNSLFRMFVATLVLLTAAPVYAANASITVASCPPWKHGEDDTENAKMDQMCLTDSARITQAIADHLPVEQANQRVLLQSDATPQNLIDTLEELRAVVGEGDTLYVFQMSHGGVLPYSYKGYPVNGEVFAYYTEAKPQDFAQAVEIKDWLSAREFRDEISQFVVDTGADALIIIEACHAESAGHQLIHNPVMHLKADERVAYIFSAGAEQTSTFTDDSTGARFTEEFVSALKEADSGTPLADVFSAARDATHRGALAYCNNLPVGMRDELLASVDQYFENCLQDPSSFDPKGLLLELQTI